MIESIWLFGYGSILWRPDFPYTAAKAARLSNFQRRFWQASTDHRGTPSRPGAVATLRYCEGAQTFGIAYRIEHAGLIQTMTQLDQREKNGYVQQTVAVTLDTGQTISAITYVAQAGNTWDLGRPRSQVLPAHDRDFSRTDPVRTRTQRHQSNLLPISSMGQSMP